MHLLRRVAQMILPVHLLRRVELAGVLVQLFLQGRLVKQLLLLAQMILPMHLLLLRVELAEVLVQLFQDLLVAQVLHQQQEDQQQEDQREHLLFNRRHQLLSSFPVELIVLYHQR